MFGLLFFQLSLLPLELKNEAPIVLDIPISENWFYVGESGSFYCIDYAGHTIRMLGSNGKVELQFGRRGFGPGELYKPYAALEMGDHQLLVLEVNGRMSIFNRDSGDFERVIQKHFPSFRLLPYAPDHFLAVQNKTDKLVQLLDIEGNVARGWFPKTEPGPVWTRKYAAASDSKNTVYFQEGTHPFVWVIPVDSERETRWELDLPLHYREPPRKGFDPGDRFDRKKIQAHFRSYTHLDGLAVLQNRYLAVLWNLHEPYSHGFDIYDIASRERLVANQVAPGNLMATDGKQLFFLELFDGEGILEEGGYRIHRYSLNAKRPISGRASGSHE